MAHPLAWPGKYFFYPIGNTSAVCLTRDLAPEEPGNILSLGCGDPRNVLYTIFSEPQPAVRKLDFTCCDHEPGILARNALLFTMVADQIPYLTIWNIFFHLYLDSDSRSALVKQCKKLVELSDTLQSWNASSYGPFLKISTAYTLAETRRHWSLYVGMQDLPHERTKNIRAAFKKIFKKMESVRCHPSTARSSGPLMLLASEVVFTQAKRYWKTGVTMSDPKKVASATELNPTLAYSLEGEGCAIHYGTDPLIPFHLASLFGNAKGAITADNAVKAAQTQFNTWCSAFYISITSPSHRPVIRLVLGEALVVCQALRAFSTNGILALGLPVAQWKTKLIELNKYDYVPGGAPPLFNVIETSNLEDYVGLLNLLTSAVPLLSTSTPSSVLYIESLLFSGPDSDATKEFTERVGANIAVMGLLLGVSPVDYLSGFTSRSNTHELQMHAMAGGNATQYHQVTTWKRSTSGDIHISLGNQTELPPVFDPRQLGTLLFDIHQELFAHEDSKTFQKMNEHNIDKAVARSNIIHYIRESFVLFLKLVRDKNRIDPGQWNQTLARFLDIQRQGHTIEKMDTLAFNDLLAQMYRHGVYKHPMLFLKFSKAGRFSQWDKLTPIVRIILVVPREKVAALERLDAGTPLLECRVFGRATFNIFTSIHVAFGKVISVGSKSNPQVLFEEDPRGRKGDMPLVASFIMPIGLLTDLEPMKDLEVSLSIRNTTAALPLMKTLGFNLHVFTAKLLDEYHVHVLPEQPLSSTTLPVFDHHPARPTSDQFSQIGKSSAAFVELDEQCELVSSLTSTISVDNHDAQILFRSAAVPQVVQISPCIMRVNIGNYAQNVVFPYPIIGSKNRLRLARKSLYIEVIVPISGPFKPDGMSLSPFPVVGVPEYKTINPWNIHRLNLSRLPILDIKAKKTVQWLNPHVASTMSSRERSNRKKDAPDTLMAVKDTIHTMLVRSAGTQLGTVKRLFALTDKTTNNCDTIIFINELRFDLHSHTIVCDGCVLPLTRNFIDRMQVPFTKLVHKGDLVNIPIREGEMRAWKLLLPAFIERCRTGWKHGENCEYKAQEKIPLTEEMEVDPLCSCGRGQNTEDMLKVDLWSKFAPHVTRFALSPLFAVSYLEVVGRDPERYKCFVCREKGKPKLKECTTCQKVRYCSKECQKKDWPVHKLRCKR